MAEGFKDFAAAEVLTAANTDDYLMRQTVMRFASAAARDTALSGVVVEGMVVYLKDADELLVYHGTQWRRPWNMPWGRVNGVQIVSNSAAVFGGATNDVGLSITFTAIANRAYRVHFDGDVVGTVAGDLLISYITDGSGNALKRATFSVPGADFYGHYSYSLYETVGAGSTTRKVTHHRNVGTGSSTIVATSTSPATLIVEDIGPNGTPA